MIKEFCKFVGSTLFFACIIYLIFWIFDADSLTMFAITMGTSLGILIGLLLWIHIEIELRK